jgi:hypothetical protein
MKLLQKKYTNEKGWEVVRTDAFDEASCQLVLAFGSREIISDSSLYISLRKIYPLAEILLNSTAGEISDTRVCDNSLTLTGIWFENTTIQTAAINILKVSSSFEAGRKLGAKLDTKNLCNVLVISDGHQVNGSELIKGLQQSLPSGTIITGGLAGDGSLFEKTLVGVNEQAQEGRIVLIGFYGNRLQVSFSSAGGWDSFGPERLITRSDGNILYELDEKPALDIYKLYLGEYAIELPGSALRFPLSIRTNGPDSSIVRTILSVNESDKSMTFAGNMPIGAYARLMKANLDRLIQGSEHASRVSLTNPQSSPDLALLISCVGRKLVLGQRIEEEVEIVREVYGKNTFITGFYSYGEISPSLKNKFCDLHNQTMTITTFTEL